MNSASYIYLGMLFLSTAAAAAAAAAADAADADLKILAPDSTGDADAASDLILGLEARLYRYVDEREREYRRTETDPLRRQLQQQQEQIDKLTAREQAREKAREKEVEVILAENKDLLEKIDRLYEHIERQNERIAGLEKLKQPPKHVKPQGQGAKRVKPQGHGDPTRMSGQHSPAEGIERPARASTMAVGFSAYISAPITHIGANQDIVFDHVVTNTGNAYNPRHGIFVAPVSGLYVFSFTNIARNANNHLQLVRNGQFQWGIFTRALESEYASSGMTMVLQLNANDDVTVQNIDPNDTIESGIFSGVLVQETYGGTSIIGK